MDGLTYCRPGPSVSAAAESRVRQRSCRTDVLVVSPFVSDRDLSRLSSSVRAAVVPVRCDARRWTPSTCLGLETPSLRRRRSSRRRDPACLTWSNVRSSLSVSGRDRTEVPEAVHVFQFTYNLFTFSPFHVFPLSAILLPSVTSVTKFCVNCLPVHWTIVALRNFSRFVVYKRESFFLLVLD